MSRDSESGQRRYLAVAQRLLTAIGNGEYKAGDRLPAHTEVAARAGVSRATAREAVLALELIGAVEVRHGEGTFVRGLGAHVFDLSATALDAAPRELIETRLHLEPIVASLSIGRISETRLATLENNVARQRTLIDDPSQVAAFTALGLQFHGDLAPACGNALLADIVKQLVDVESHPLWALVNQRGMVDRDARKQQVDEHVAVVQAIRQGRPVLAAEAMRLHLVEMELQVFAATSATARDRVGQ